MTIRGVLVAEPLTLAVRRSPTGCAVAPRTMRRQSQGQHRLCRRVIPGPSERAPITRSHVAVRLTYSGMPAMTAGLGQRMMAARRMSDPSGLQPIEVQG